MKNVNDSTDHKPLLDAVKLLQQQGEKHEALILVKKALQKYPQDVETALLAGLLYQEMKHTGLAEKSFRQALSIDPKNPQVLKSLGLFIITQSQKSKNIIRQHAIPTKAVDILKKYLKLIKWNDYEILKIVSSSLETDELKEAWETTLSPEIGLIFAKHLRWSSEYESAISILQLLAKHSPSPEFLFELGDEFNALRDFEKAIPVYEEAFDLLQPALKDSSEGLEIKGSHRDSIISRHYRDLASCYRAIGKEKLALQAASNSILFEESYGDNWTAKLQILLEQKEYQKAIEVAKQALDAHKEEEFFWFGGPDEANEFFLAVAKSFEMGGQTEEALKILVDSINDYTGAESYIEVFRIFRLLGRIDEAVAIFEKMIQKTQEEVVDRIFHLIEYIFFLREAGRGDTIWKNIDQFMEKEGKVIVAAVALFILRLIVKPSNIEEEQDFIDQTIEYIDLKLKDIPFAIEAILEVRFMQGRLDECIDILNQLLKPSPPNLFRVVFLNNLGYAQLINRDFDNAEKSLSRALALATENPDLKSSILFSGMTFFLDNTIIIYDWVDLTRVKLNPFEHLFTPDMIIDAVKVNLITLALAKGDPDQATTIAFDLLSISGRTEISAYGYLVLLFIARFRNDIKTARYAWNNYLKHKEKYESIKIFRERYPGLYRWLVPTKRVKQFVDIDKKV